MTNVGRYSFRIAMALVIGCLLANCATPAQRAMMRDLNEYRANANKNLAKMDVDAELLKEGRRDPEFDAIYTRQLTALLNKQSVVTAKIIKNVKPAYPPAMRAKYKEAVIHFVAIVGKEGKLRSIRYVPLPNITVEQEFIDAATEAFTQWEFSPGTIDGQPAEFSVIFPLIFSLR